MIIPLFPTPNACVSRCTVHVAEYSEANGGSDHGTVYAVEVMFPDGTSEEQWFRDLAEARRVAEGEAAARGADLLAECFWPNRRVAS